MHDPVINPKQFDRVTCKFFDYKKEREVAYMREAASQVFCKLENLEKATIVSERYTYFITFYDFGDSLRKHVYEVKMEDRKSNKSYKTFLTGTQLLSYIKGSDGLFLFNEYAKWVNTTYNRKNPLPYHEPKERD